MPALLANDGCHVHAREPAEISCNLQAVGGLGTVSVEPASYDTDYWASCYREATMWASEQVALRQPLQANPVSILGAANSFSQECIQPYMPSDWQLATTLDPAAKALPREHDFYIATTRWSMHLLYPDSTVVHRVQRAGATLCLVKSDRGYMSSLAMSEPHAQTAGGAPHPLLSVGTIRDAGQERRQKEQIEATQHKDHSNRLDSSLGPGEEDPSQRSSGGHDTQIPLDQPAKLAAAPAAESVVPAAVPTKQKGSSGSSPMPYPPAVRGSGSTPLVAPPDMRVQLPSGTTDDQSSAMYKYALANKYRDVDRIPEALAAYEVSVVHETALHSQGLPSSPAPFNNLGSLLERLGQVPRAVEVYTKAIELHPDFGLGKLPCTCPQHQLMCVTGN